ncbi:MAG: PHP domain-containing protein [Candidatus ainarchaeum sp.]|nr:PHP domain-containing protein [Candidatus ainarchaeum sp.]
MKIDLHCHTKYSKDAMSSLDEIFYQAQKKGLDGIAITDHENTKGWNDALIAAKKYNMQVVLGEEIKSKNGDILGLFLNKEINMKGECPKEIIAEIQAQNGIAIIPHPFDFNNPFKDVENYLKLVDGIEIFNARRIFNKDNDKAKKLSEKYPHLNITAGSDNHIYNAVGYAYVESSANTLEDFKKDLLNKNVKWFGKKAPPLYLLTPFLKKIKNAIFR